MHGWVVGTATVIGAALAGIPMYALGVPNKSAAVIIMAIATIGFAIQMGSAFRMRSRFKHEMAESQKSHAALMAHAQTLPPERAIALLLKHIK